jgi:dCMP deaminase
MGKKREQKQWKGAQPQSIVLDEATGVVQRLNDFTKQMNDVAERIRNNTARQEARNAATAARRRAGSRAAVSIEFDELREDGRPTFDALYLAVAQTVGMAADCSRPNGLVGAVAVRDDVPLAWGYVGVAAGFPGCLSGACPRATSDVLPGTDYDNCISQHAEVNLIGFAAHHGISLADATLYVSREPCKNCYKAISAARIVRVVWQLGLTASAPA